MSKKHVRRVSLLATVVLSVISGALLFTSLRLSARSFDPEPPTSAELEVALRLAGLQPAHLAAAGLSSNEVSGLVANASAHVQQGTDPAAAIAAAGAARQELRRLERLIRSGQATEQDFTDRATAAQQLQSLDSAAETALDDLFDAATADLADADVAVLETIRGNEHWTQPVQFLAVDLSESDRVALRDALANERISARYGDDPDPEAQALLQDLESLQAVAQAKSSLDSSLATVQSAWDAAVEP